VHLYAAQTVGVVDDQLFDDAFDDANGAGEQWSARRWEGVGWGEVDEVVGPLADDLRVPDGTWSPTSTPSCLVADLVAVQ